MQKMDITAMSAPKNTAHAIPRTAISKDPMELSDDEDEPSVELATDDDADDPALFADGASNV